MENYQSGNVFRKSKTGMYVVFAIIAVLIVAGAVFWLAGPKIFGEGSLTGASLVSGLEPEEDSFVAESSKGLVSTIGESSSESGITSQTPNGMYAELSLDTIPVIKKEIKVNSLDLKFTDLSTQIKVNTEKLELNYLKSVDLKITNFVGKVAIDGNTVSLEGVAGKIKVNDISVSDNLKISFSNLNYDSVVAEGIAVESITAAKGVGTLDVQNGKLIFAVGNDPLALTAFTGNIGFDKSVSVPVSIKGYVEEINVGGELPFALK